MGPLRAALALAAAAALAGCGGERAAPVATTEVTMPQSYRFDPEAIAVDAGATVTWRNEDVFTHTVQVDGREDRKVEPGESVSIRFADPGTFRYVCTLHPRDMEGEVVVR